MNPPTRSGGGEDGALQVLWGDGERVFCRTWRESADGRRQEFIAVTCAGEQPTPGSINRLTHEYGLKDHLDAAWALRPLDLVHERGQAILLLEPTRGEPLDRLIGRPMEVGRFLRLAVALSASLRPLHQRGLIHKDIKPTNILVDVATEQIRLTGFGIASRLPRERQAPGPPEVIAGTLAYMAPEQTGRMNRSIDSRSDLYALGVTLYEMLTGSLPFAASDPMEWVHCHIARQAVAPGERASGIPDVLSSIVMKLLAKTPEERYQTAAGVEADLRRCLSEWQAHGRIDPFPVGAHDASDRLLIAEELYGREREIDSLLASFDRVVTQGAPELVLVSGYSGVGKSSVVNELHRALAPRRGLFAAGKFDQYKRDIPYATLAQAFQTLIRQILVKSEAEVEQWRGALTEALGAHGQLIVNLVPELEFVIGKQPAVAELPPRDAQNRFQLAFRRFLGAFARREHPLVLFLDDLQWLDAATLDLIEHLVTEVEVGRLLLIGAYRDNEVDSAHPLLRMLEAIKKTDARVGEIVLAPLGLDDIGRLIASALHGDVERARPLTRLVYEKTGGNPFFAIQFLTELAEEGLLEFHPAAQGWRWEIDRIHAKGYTDNVVDLMVEKLKRLPPSTQEAMKLLACVGHVAEIDALTLGYEETEEAMHAALWEAVYAGLIDRQDGGYRFLHDRIQQAAYSLIPDGRRGDIHLRIGRALLANMTADQLAEHLFDVAGQFNRGAGQLIERHEKAHVATINLRAGRKAKASSAYASACVYLAAGMALLDERDWDGQYELAFSLRFERAECELLSGNFEEAAQLIADLLQHAALKVDQATAYRLKVLLHTLKSENDQAVNSALSCLRLFGIDIPAHPTQSQVRAEYETVWQILDGRPIESLIDLPMMTDPEMLAAIQVLSVLLPPAYHTDFHLWCLLPCRMVKVSMEHGTSGASAHGCADLGQILGPVFHRYSEGYRFAELACDLVEKHGFVAYRAKVYHMMGVVAVWTQPIASSINFLRTAFRAATETGDLAVACYCMDTSVTDFLMRNDPLDAVWRESEIGVTFVRKARFHDVAAVIVSQQRFIATMQGRPSAFSTFSDAQFDETAFEAQITADGTATTVGLYWILKLQARFLSGDYLGALASATKAKALLWAVTVHFQRLDYFYYTALAVAALYENASAGDRQAWRDLLAAHREQLCEWAENYPPTFADKHALVSAEIARIEGRELDAERLYEQAIRSARASGFVHHEALACEVAARFYAARGFGDIGEMYLFRARGGYLRWGAGGMVRQLEALYPRVATANMRGLTRAAASSNQQLDVAAMVKASQALSSEMLLPRLIERLMTIALQSAGADHGLLILLHEDNYRIEAEARTDVEGIVHHYGASAGKLAPETIIRYVLRTQESVILDDAAKQNLFSEDPYFSTPQPRSVFCLPLVRQGVPGGLLYLENTLASHVFTPDRATLIELLASQAAISLENTRLYGDLQEREARVRRLVDSNIIGIFIWDLEGRITDANEAFLQMVECRREDLGFGGVRWTDQTPPEWRDRDEQAMKALKTIGTVQPYEKEFFKKDGTRVPVLVGAAIFDGSGDQGVAFVVDLSDRKRAEAAARESERRYHEVHMELAHANRVATLGQLSASIAHEINQPLAGIITNASTGLRMLAADPPNIEGARETARRTIRDGNRANEVIKRLRALFSKTDLTIESVDLNEATREVIALSSSEFQRGGMIWHAELADDLPLVKCDRVQLQQVVLNLLRNALDSMSAVDDRPKQLIITTAINEPDHVTLAVQDSGPGVDPANLERVFDAFYSTKPGGLGMGLSICRAIVEAHGGKLWATTGTPHGATFQLTLPVTADNGSVRTSFAVSH
jgi:PAS domain S-box-containing protein